MSVFLPQTKAGTSRLRFFRSGVTGLDGYEKLTSLNFIEPEIVPVCEITHCAQNYTFRVQYGKIPLTYKFYTDAGGSRYDHAPTGEYWKDGLCLVIFDICRQIETYLNGWQCSKLHFIIQSVNMMQ